jgi:Holliday junction resolvase RusA-like endonuclease
MGSRQTNSEYTGAASIMNVQSFVIHDWQPPSLNRLMHGHWASRWALKQKNMEVVIWAIKQCKIKPVDKCTVKIRIFADNRRADEDNIKGSGLKIILDSLKNAGIIHDDSKRYVESSNATIEYIKNEPYTEVIIEEIEE